MSDQHGDDDWVNTRVVLIICCVLAVLLAGLLVGAFSSGGLAGSPVDSVLPGEQVYEEYIDDPTSDSFGERQGGLGALNPGNGTGVGGEISFDADTFGANDTEIHFVVESSAGAYWRTGTYSTYTGTGWERDGNTTAYEEPLEHDGIQGEQVEYEVTLNRSATAVPTVWRPTTVSGLDSLEVTDDGAIRTAEPLEPGTTFSGVSQTPEHDVTLLRAAGTSYPEEIQQQYTQLPSDTPDRVGEFTTDLTADVDDPYDVATEIQNWLRTEKDYSLGVSTGSSNVADTFIFEMEAGYCEFFATAMTTMLRTQDIPARYVVGYSTGQSVGENIYEVRGMNAHAWVEVYFPDVGWVSFDPTPGGDRLATQQAILEEVEPEEEFEFREEGSPGEWFEPGEIDVPTPPNDTQPPENIRPPENDTGGDGLSGYDILLNRTAVPGTTVEISVTYLSEPAPDMAVTLNGEFVGVTDADGTVTVTVPFEEELRIAIRQTDDTPQTRSDDTGTTQHLGGGGFATPLTGQFAMPSMTESVLLPTAESDPSSTASAESDPSSTASAESDPSSTATVDSGRSSSTAVESGTDDNTSDREPDEEAVYQVETDATVTVSGDTLPGNDVTVTVLVDGVAISGADVFVDGELQSRTDEGGRATVTLPETSGNTTITAEREIISGTETVVIPELEVTVESDALLALPFTSATVEATYGNASAVGAAVELDGEQVGTTGPGGTATVQLPLQTAATFTVTDGGVADTATIENLLRNLLLVLAVGGVVVGAIASVVASQARTVRGTVVGLVHTLAGLVAGSKWLLVTAATQGDVLLERALRRLQITVKYGVAVLTGETSLSELRTAFFAWLAARRESSIDDVSQDTVGYWDGSEAYVTVRTAWGQFLDHVSITEATTRTPGELATHAIECDGLPPEAVATLRDTFREVEYGGRSASDRLERVQRAIDEIERALEEVEERPAGGAD